MLLLSVSFLCFTAVLPSVFGPDRLTGLPVSSGTVQVPLLNAYMEVVAEVAAEFVVVRPLTNVQPETLNAKMYWKQTAKVCFARSGKGV